MKCINAERHPEATTASATPIGDRHDIVLIDTTSTRPTRTALTASCDCYVSLHRSEGLGLTMAEAMYLGKPVIATGYSGNIDFMRTHNSYPVDYRLVPIGDGSAPYPPEAEWAEPDVEHAARLMREVFEQPDEARRRGASAALDMRAQYSIQATGLAIDARLRRIAPRLARAPREIGDGAHHGRSLPAAPVFHEPVPTGPLRAAARRAIRRAIRPYTQWQAQVNRWQGEVNSKLDKDARAAEVRLAEHLTRLYAGTMGQLRRQERELERLSGELDALRMNEARSGRQADLSDSGREG